MDFFANIIKDKISFGNENEDAFNIAYGIDQRFFMPMGVSILSVIKTNPHESLFFHIFTDTLAPYDQERLLAITKLYPAVKITVYHVNEEKFNAFPAFFIWSRAMYYRFAVSHALKDTADRFLYLDADVLCLSPLEKFYRQDFAEIAAVIADYKTMVGYAKKNIGLQGDQYFNSGVMLVDIKKWNNAQISQRSVKMLLEENNYKYYDQDVLNLLLWDNVKFLPKRYNFIYHLIDLDIPLPADTVLLHYSGSVKPWQAWGQFHPLTKLWLEHKDASPWQDVPLQQPKTYKEAKFMARTMKRKMHDYPAYLKWLFIYGLWKLRTKLSKK